MSGVDMNTQKSFEKLDERCVAVVIDPIQSVKGKVGWNLEEGVIEGAITLHWSCLVSSGVVH
jgi:hypothetical protein